MHVAMVYEIPLKLEAHMLAISVLSIPHLKDSNDKPTSLTPFLQTFFSNHSIPHCLFHMFSSLKTPYN